MRFTNNNSVTDIDILNEFARPRETIQAVRQATAKIYITGLQKYIDAYERHVKNGTVPMCYRPTWDKDGIQLTEYIYRPMTVDEFRIHELQFNRKAYKGL